MLKFIFLVLLLVEAMGTLCFSQNTYHLDVNRFGADSAQITLVVSGTASDVLDMGVEWDVPRGWRVGRSKSLLDQSNGEFHSLSDESSFTYNIAFPQASNISGHLCQTLLIKGDGHTGIIDNIDCRVLESTCTNTTVQVFPNPSVDRFEFTGSIWLENIILRDWKGVYLQHHDPKDVLDLGSFSNGKYRLEMSGRGCSQFMVIEKY